ncbi:hypothetical protein, partial [Nocardia cyriacigeorgica]|uniref:hypothetical protein n=1 Tax=Nocardia cyriacigeorgica TaxID=135487 RepID=UPI00211594A4
MPSEMRVCGWIMPRRVNRGSARAAPNAEVYEATLLAGHFGLVAGSVATNHTWPTVRDWIGW